MGFSVKSDAPGDQPANEKQAPPELEFSTSRGDHLNEFRAPELDPGNIGPDAVAEVGEDGEPVGFDDIEPEQLSRDAFHEVFKMGFNMPGMFAAAFKPLAIQPGEESPCRAASDAIYRLLEIYYPRALMPAGETVALLVAAAPFFIAKAMVAREIMQHMRAAKEAEKRPVERDKGQAAANPPQEPANSPERPKGGAHSWMDGEDA